LAAPFYYQDNQDDQDDWEGGTIGRWKEVIGCAVIKKVIDLPGKHNKRAITQDCAFRTMICSKLDG